MLLIHKVGWTLWALLPVAGLTYHYGPGQRAYSKDRAADIIAEARELDSKAQSAQASAYQLHLASLTARRAAVESKSPGDAAMARDAASKEDEAYKAAGAAWRATAEKLQQAQDLLASCDSEKSQAIRIEKDRALVRSGSIAEGVGDLEAMLESLGEVGQQDSPLAARAREEAATGYYYGARLLRAAGKPSAEWLAVSGEARQNFRYLAESGAASGATSPAADLQKNLELVLNLEQASQEDLLAKPLPKNSPRANCDGLCKKPGKGKRPPRKGKDARGASGVGEIDAGW